MLFQPWLRHGRNTGKSVGAEVPKGSLVQRELSAQLTEGLSKTASDLIRPFGPPSPPRGRLGGTDCPLVGVDALIDPNQNITARSRDDVGIVPYGGDKGEKEPSGFGF